MAQRSAREMSSDHCSPAACWLIESMVAYGIDVRLHMYIAIADFLDGNFLLLRPYHGEHEPKVPVTPEYIVLQRVLRKRECMSILSF
jgi:hypothetical protein